MSSADWFSWNDGETRTAVRVQEVVAVVQRPNGGSVVHVRGGQELPISESDAVKLETLLGIDKPKAS
jgi:hypothetical protein